MVIVKAALSVALVATVSAAPASPPVIDTECSHPQREGVRAHGTMQLPWSQLSKLDDILGNSEPELGMSYSAVESGMTGQPSTKKTIILQSPKFSVAIEVVAQRSSPVAEVKVERTCINDDFEPWRPYWQRFLSFMLAKGYPIQPGG